MAESMDNMYIYEQCKEVPKEAKRTIKAGRLKGKTDINPMWRIKKLTEVFGPCGIGWRTLDEKYTKEKNETTGEVAIFCELKLIYRQTNGEWSEPVFGVGGNMLVAQENVYDGNGKKIGKALHLNDEAYKMAYTDAISVACKSLGMGAEVYWEAGSSKYTQNDKELPVCSDCGAEINGVQLPTGETLTANDISQRSIGTYGRCLCWECARRARAAS